MIVFKSLKFCWTKILSIVFFIILLGVYVYTFAVPPATPYSAGETLDPTCAPEDENCTVSLEGLTLSDFSGTSPINYDNTTGTFSVGQSSSTNDGYLSSVDWSTFNNKQNALNGTGFVKISGSTISYDNSSYLTSYTETDPTIYAWAKAADKPSYSWSEILLHPTVLSEFTNDSGFITDGNTNWNNSYGFITDGNAGWENSYGFITDGNTGWDNSYGFITDGNTGWDNSYGFITGINSLDVTTALGYTPYSSTNPASYISSYTETDPVYSAWDKDYADLINTPNMAGYATTSSPTFTGTVSVEDLSVTGDIIPTTTNTYSLGSADYVWKDIYVGPGSIYVNGQKVLQTDLSDSVVVSADPAQNLVLKTTEGGNIELNPASGGGAILLKSNVTLTSGKVIRTSDLSPLIFSDGISTPSITTPVLNGGIAITPNGTGNTYVTSGNFGIGTTAPNAKLDIKTKAGSTEAIRLDSPDAGAAVDIHLGSSTPAALRIYASDSALSSSPAGAGFQAFNNSSASYPGQIYFDSGAHDNAALIFRTAVTSGTISERMRINSSGNVGIGTATPSAKLDVSAGNLDLDSTTNTNKYGIITKDGNRFIHDFNYGNNGTVTTAGENIFIGLNAGNFTMGSTATAVSHASYNVGVGGSTLNSNTIGFYNSAIGYGSLQKNTTGNYNSAVGYQSLNSNIAGSYNSALGVNSLLLNTTGYHNSAVGYASLYSNTTGIQNSALGFQSLYRNTGGGSNSAIGYNSLFSNTTGSNNSALGLHSLYSNTIGNNNSALGIYSLSSNTTGSYNSALGVYSLNSNKTGSNNTAMGRDSGRFIADGTTGRTTGENGLYLGYSSKASADGTNNEIVIGYNAIGQGSNTIQLGSTDILRTYAKGLNLGAGTATAGTAPLKFTSGTNLTTPEAGAIEFDGNNLYFTDSTPTRQTLLTSSNLGASLGSYVPYTGATGAVTLGANILSTTGGLISPKLYPSSDSTTAIQFNKADGTTNVMNIDTTNSRVGIGTTAPTSLFTIQTAGAGVPFTIKASNGTNRAYFTSGIGESYSLSLLDNSSVETVKLNSLGNSWLNGGNVGIGTTTPAGRLHIVGAFVGAGAAPLIVQNTNAYADPWTQYSQVWLDSSGNEMASMRNDGSFTMSGGQGFVKGNRFLSNGYGSAANPVFSFNGDSDNGMFRANTDILGFSTAGSERIRIDSAGNVGIGTTTPSAQLTQKSTTSLESAPLGSELLSSSGWTSTGWSGDFSSGFTHTTGNTTALTNSLVPTINNYYQVALTVTGRTAGTFTITFGGVTSQSFSGTGTFGPKATSTDALSITPTSTFDGTITVSIKQITGNYNPTYVIQDSTGANNFEIRSSLASLNNTFIGRTAGRYNTTGNNNTANGFASLYSNTTGYYNTANGVSSLQNNTTGNNNTANGYASLYSNTTGVNNTANGMYSLFSNTTGNNNTANGYASLNSNTTGNNNTANGYASLYSNTTGVNNTALGYQSARYIADGTTGRTTGNNGLYLGYNTKASADGTDNEIVVGYNAIGNGSNTATIGNSSVTNTYFGSSTGASKLWGSALNLSGLTASSVLFTDANKNLTSTGIGTSSQFIKGDGSLDSNTYLTSSSLSGYVPYTGATGAVTLGANTLSTTSGLISPKLYPASDSTTAIQFNKADGTTNVMNIDTTNGYVGIGTTTPNEQLEITKNFRLSSTTHANQYGIIYKDETPFIHDFNYGDNGTVTTNGFNLFIGNAGNLTMGSTATSVDNASYNTGIGAGALSLLTTGAFNTAIGRDALRGTTTGQFNLGFSYRALYSNTDGNYNIGIGSYAGRYIADGTTANTTGDYNVFIGSATKALADNDQNEIVIGYNTTGSGSNTATIGNSSLLRTYLTGVNLKAGTATAGTAPLKFTSGTNLTTTEAGAVEYDGSHLYFTAANGGTRYQLDQQSAGSAPNDATYITQTANGTLTNEQSLGSLATGILKNTTTTGVLSIAVAGDFPTLNQNTTGTAAGFTGSLSGEVTGGQSTTVVGNAAVIGKVLTGYTAGAGTITASDSILSAIQKLSGNIAANGNGTVTSVDTTAANNGVTATWTNTTTTPRLTIGLGAITPTSVNGVVISGSTTPTLSVTGTSSISGSNTGDETTATIKTKLGAASTSTDGYLTSTDWNTFNNKVSMVYPGSGIPNSTGSAWGTSYSTTGSGTVVALATTPTFTTNITTPLVVGGTSTTQDLTFKTTSGTGATGADMHFLVGSNGGTEALTILNSGYVGIGNTSPTSSLTVSDISGDPTVELDGGSNSWYLYQNVSGKSFGIKDSAGGSDVFTIAGSTPAIGNVGIGVSSPSAVLHLKAGTTTNAPFKLTSGINLTTTEAGAIEYNGSHLYFTATNGGTRYQLDQQSGGSMTYPGSGIAVSTGTAWGTSISGTSSQFVKGDGSLDSSTYLTGTLAVTVVNTSNLFSTGLSGTGSGVTSTTNSVFLGVNAGNGATGAYDSNFIGHNAGNGGETSYESNFIGLNAGSGATSAEDSNFIGVGAGFGAAGAYSSTFMGYAAGHYATGAYESNFIGNSAGDWATGAFSSNFLGSNAGYNAENAYRSLFMGLSAGNGATNASNSIFIGQQAGKDDTVDNTSDDNNWSILIGYNTTTGSFKNSILLGGSSSTTAISNTKANQFMLAPTVTEMRLRGVDYTLPSAQGSSGQVLTNNGSGGLSWSTVSGSGLAIGNSITNATQGSILFAGASGVLAQNNTNLNWDDDHFILSLAGDLDLKGQKSIHFNDSDNSNYLSFQAPATVSSNVRWTLPSADANGCFKSDGSGNMSVGACGDTNEQLFSANGNYTIPTNALMIIVEAWGGGGGGAGGYGGASGTVRSGGAGGGGGAYTQSIISASHLGSAGSNIPVTIGSSGTAGTGGTTGSDGGAGGRSCVSSSSSCGGTVYASAYGGGGGNGGSGTAGSGGGGGGGSLAVGTTNGTQATGGTGGNPLGAGANTANSGAGGAGGATASTSGVAGGSGYWGGAGGGASTSAGGAVSGAGGGSFKGGGGGGAGGTVGTSYTFRAGGNGGYSLNVSGGGGTGGASAGAAGGSGSAGTVGGGAGGGGGGSNSTTGGAGGSGGQKGGGGGGGGAGNSSGGNGGTGGTGYVRVYTMRGAGADLAEAYGTFDDTITAGEVVALDEGMKAGVKKTSKAYDSGTIGVVSTNPGLIIGEIEDESAEPVLVALSGRVPVKVNLENGPIKKGDYITPSSEPGVAMRATKAGTIIGQAMTEYTDEDNIGYVVAFIKSGPSNGTKLTQLLPGLSLDAVSGGGQDVAESEVDGESESEIDGDTGEVTEIAEEETIQKMALKYFLANKMELAQATEISEIYTDRLSAALEIITPTVITDTLSTNSVVASTGEVISFNSPAEFVIPPLFNSDTAGFALIKEGDRRVRVTYKEPYIGEPVVSADLAFNVLDGISDIFAKDLFEKDLKYIIVDSDQEGFTILINQDAPRDLRFSWTALSVKDPEIFESVIEGLVLEKIGETTNEDEGTVVEEETSNNFSESDTTINKEENSSEVVGDIDNDGAMPEGSGADITDSTPKVPIETVENTTPPDNTPTVENTAPPNDIEANTGESANTTGLTE